jgi:SAM-dependent methyltransferase
MNDDMSETGSSPGWSKLSDRHRARLLTTRVARRIVPYPLRHAIGVSLSRWRVRHSRARIYQRRVILPMIASRNGTALLVGVREYNASEPAYLEQRGVVCWTLDFDPAAAQWGAAGRHVITSIEQAPARFDAATFDTIMLSGVFGFGLDDAVVQDAAVRACACLLKPDGLLILGWNTHLVADPSGLPHLERCFGMPLEDDMPRRVPFRGSTHVFDFHIRNHRPPLAAG